MKPPELLESELEHLLERKSELVKTYLPSDLDSAVDELNHMSGIVLSNGGAETLLRVLREARSAGIA